MFDRQQFSELRFRWCMLAAIICSAALKIAACHPFESQNGQSAKVAGFEENLPMCVGLAACSFCCGEMSDESHFFVYCPGVLRSFLVIRVEETVARQEW